MKRMKKRNEYVKRHRPFPATIVRRLLQKHPEITVPQVNAALHAKGYPALSHVRLYNIGVKPQRRGGDRRRVLPQAQAALEVRSEGTATKTEATTRKVRQKRVAIDPAQALIADFLIRARALGVAGELRWDATTARATLTRSQTWEM